METIRIWDLPTRLFHWALFLAVVGMLVTANIGGNAMNLHLRLGYAIFTLLLFRLAWGFVGGRWSRFASFVPSPARLMRYLRGQGTAHDEAGHNPLGALSVLALLLALGLQVTSGLFADDEIATSGPLTARASSAAVKLASRYHTTLGKLLIIALVVLHIAAIAWHQRRGRNLVKPMVSGDKPASQVGNVTASRDDAGTRVLALVLLAICAAVVYALVQWGERAGVG